jgi:aryl-alcohol dehydrogenase-like predicted oxidoreductase
MRMVTLTGTDLCTSRLGFGTSGIHQVFGSARRQRLLEAAFNAGIRHFDTSPFYGHGIAERELGRFASQRRGELIVATKFGLHARALLARAPWLMYAQLSANAMQRKITRRNLFAVSPRLDYSAQQARSSLEQSLRALRTDHVDILFVHDPTAACFAPSDELLLMLERLRREGKARYIGMAGGARDCVDLAVRFFSLASILQIEAGEDEFRRLRQAGLPCHASYGHFRDKNAPIKDLLKRALEDNASGVVLCSSRSTTHVAQLAAYLDELERR